ncbi:MAG: glycosyltransferase family 4 protein [Kiloniellales bacterium]
MPTTIAHLIDDSSPGGVNRVLDHLLSSPMLGRIGQHEIVRVKRGRLSTPSVQADIIVSHLSVCWRNLPLLVGLRGRYADRPLIHVEHSYSQGFVAANVAKRARFHSLLRTSYSLFDKVVAVSEGQAAWMELRGLVPAGRLVTIPPCVDLAPFLRVPSKQSDTTRVFGALGRFDRQKGFDILIKAFRDARLEDAELHLIGDGPELARLRELADGDPRICFRPFTDEPAAAIASLDLVAMPSRWEPYGLVALETLAAARPLLCATRDGLGDHLRSGAFGVGGGSVSDWARALEAAQRRDWSFTLRRGRQAALQAEQRFAHRWRTLIEEHRRTTGERSAA